MIKNFKPRLYQETILATCTSKNTLVVLPTGMGKTAIFLMLASHRLKLYPKSKILFIGPTRPLIEQYYQVFLKHFDLDKEKYAIFTGAVKPEKRAELWKKATIIFSTPQGLENDIISRRINLEDVSLLGVDEAHRAVGDYAYVFVAKQYQKLAKYPRIIALTASPGSDLEKIKEICSNLFIEAIEARTYSSLDVQPYIQEIRMEWRTVKLPAPFLDVQKCLKDFLKDRLKKLKELKIVRSTNISSISKKELLAMQGALSGRIARGEKNVVLWQGISLLAEVFKIYYALELLETQGIVALYRYFEKLMSEASKGKVKASKNITEDVNFKKAFVKVEQLYKEKVEHPKLIELQKIVEKEVRSNSNIKIIVFNQYRDNVIDIQNKLNSIKGVKAKIFVGQLKKQGTGLSQRDQKKVLEEFRDGKFNVLCCTSIGEEGLDIPKVDLVIFYEPIPSAIRTIQRKGRTGRLEKGRVIILMTEGTRDVAYRWVAHHKEKRMYRILENLKSKLALKKKEVTLNSFIPDDKIIVFVDYREKPNKVVKELIDLGVEIKLEKLDIGDYILSGRVGVEFKTVSDFVNSLVNGRLLQQIKELKNNFERPLLIVEGEEDIYSIRNVHPNAIRGVLSSIAIDYGVPILFSRNYKETGAYLYLIAKREQEEIGREFSPHGSKKPMTLKEQQEYFISSLPGIGIGLARPLLRKFKTVRKIINAKEEQLEKVEGIGPKKARAIKDVVEKEYKD